MERFEVRAWDDAGVHVVRVSGDFDISGCRRFRDASERPDAELVVVDLRDATFLDSSALSELIRLQRRTETRRRAARDPAPGRQGRPDLQADRD